MFLKLVSQRFLILLSITILIFSCATSGDPEKAELEAETPNVEPVYEPEESTKLEPETFADEASAMPPAVLLPMLQWTSSSEYQNNLSDVDRPDVVFHEIIKSIESDSDKEYEDGLEKTDVIDSTGKVSPNLLETSGTSFLELLFDENKSEAVDRKVYTPEPAAVADATPVLETESESFAEVEPVPVQKLKKMAIVREIAVTAVDGEGWLLDSYTDDSGGVTDRIKYTGREYLKGTTVFSFYPYSTGVFIIKLRKPDYSTGLNERFEIELEVVEELYEDDVVQVDESEIEIALESQFESELQVAHETLSTPQNAEELLQGSEMLQAAGDCTGAADFIENNIDSISWNELDGLYFNLAGLYENCSSIRDERKAVEYYKKIVDYYPISNYWIMAKERIIYLERNFIHIR